MKKVILSIMALVVLSGCSSKIVELKIASTNDIDLNKNKYEIGQEVEASDKNGWLLFIPTGVSSIEGAMSRAIAKNSCAVGLSDLTIYNQNFSLIPYLYGISGYKVKGNLILDTSLPDCSVD